MLNEKKTIGGFLAGVVVLSFAACGGNDGVDTAGADEDASAAAQEVSGDTDAQEAAADTISLLVNTEGMGQIAQAEAGEEPAFDDEFPKQSLAVNLQEPADYVLGAKADEGWKFVGWMKDGETFSTDEQITVTVSEDMELVAVFEVEE